MSINSSLSISYIRCWLNNICNNTLRKFEFEKYLSSLEEIIFFLVEDCRLLKRCWISYREKINCHNSCLTGRNIYETGTPGKQRPNRDCPGDIGTVGTFAKDGLCMFLFISWSNIDSPLAVSLNPVLSTRPQYCKSCEITRQHTQTFNI